MRIQTKGNLFFEIVKIKNAVKKQDSALLTSYYDQYLEQLSVPSKEVFHAGCFTLYSEKISYHLLSIYLLLDLIDFYWDGKKFINLNKENNPELLTILNLEKTKSFEDTEIIKENIHMMQKITKHRLHVFLMPFEFHKDYSLEITYPGNVLILFPTSGSPESLYDGVSDFYLKKHQKEILPHWAETSKDFQTEFKKWCRDVPSKFSARRVN